MKLKKLSGIKIDTRNKIDSLHQYRAKTNRENKMALTNNLFSISFPDGWREATTRKTYRVILLNLIVAFLSFGHTQGANMNNSEIEKMISEGNSDILSPQCLKNIDKKEYLFVARYVKSAKPDVRNVAICFLLEMNQPWCYPIYLVALNDPISSHRAFAAEGILKLSTAGKTEELFSEIERQEKHYAPDERTAIPDLILTIGNVGTKEYIDKLLKTVGNDRNSDLVSALQSALAKLGDKEAIHQIENTLVTGNPEEKMDALEKVIYLKNKSWVTKVIPLLQDNSAAMSFEIGPHKVRKKVSDFAVNTLIAIDVDKNIPLKPMEAFPYEDQDILMVKKMYNIPIDPKQELK